MKFDVAIMNPPYNRDLHLDILQEVMKNCDKVVNISPIRWLQDPLEKYKAHSKQEKYRNIVEKMEDLSKIDSTVGSQIFSATFQIDLGIYTIGRGGYKIPEYPVLDKILAHKDKIGFPKRKLADKKYSNFVILANIYGGRSCSQNMFVESRKNNGFCSISMSSKVYGDYFVNDLSNRFRESVQDCKRNRGGYCGKIENWEVLDFGTEQELKNFLDFIQTKFFKYVIFSITIAVNPHYDFLPYMKDYTRAWTDADLCKEFGITGYISDDQAVPGSEWDTILKAFDCK